MSDESPEVIAAQMVDTRAALSDKVAALEQTVVGTIQNATTSVQDTIDAVKTSVQDTVQSVSNSVKNTLDIREQVRENPWAAVGLSAVSGFVVGFLSSSRTRGSSAPVATLAQTPYSSVPTAYTAPAAPREPGVVDDLLSRVGHEARTIGESFIATLAASLKETISTEIPKRVEQVLNKPEPPLTPHQIDSATFTSYGAR